MGIPRGRDTGFLKEQSKLPPYSVTLHILSAFLLLPHLSVTHTPQSITLYTYFLTQEFQYFAYFLVARYKKDLLVPPGQQYQQAAPGNLLETQNLSPVLHCRLQNLHFIRFSRRFLYTVKFEKHCFSKHPLGFCHRVVSLLQRKLTVDLLAKP